MNPTAHAELRSAQEILQNAQVTQAVNGICYATAGEITLPSSELERLVVKSLDSIAGRV